jgi:hypothetical protein
MTASAPAVKWVVALVGASIISSAWSQEYASIAHRNLFGLREPAIEIITAPPPVVPTVTLTGIVTILGRKQAFLTVQPVARQDSKTGPQSFILNEGQAQDEIQVLEIDERAGRVKINNHGVILNLAFEKTGTASFRPPL